MSQYEKTLEEWIEVIKENKPFVDIKLYSHNLITIALQAIAKNWGISEANKIILDMGLKKLGWREQ